MCILIHEKKTYYAIDPLFIDDTLATFQQKLRLQRYAENTIKTYSSCLSKFLKAFQRYQIDQMTAKNIENYIAHLVENEAISDSFQKQMLGTKHTGGGEADGRESKNKQARIATHPAA